ncbi:hypothetical protein CHGG_07144 [Chaetomium globosum CBS 148.51]|uniref:CSI2 protein n=1 Tax=Chaetomium globosum (strain ATCC 6205 / CBS 148.51 / DSM 1962 / NBRC 6347 / NRRL 1970) TaxID=306901 RepID=Q2GY10_CHAGB|nr:uncharacterized protein CHGG_07144 [Chaetomium globosum CBS 148.51]EAQ85891.1 hypothetical protein CHGG_07144 [Chaetomium globosum CBS 148.51]
MGSSPLSLKRALLLTAFFALRAVAQGDNENDNRPTDEPNNNPPAVTNTRENPPAQQTETTSVRDPPSTSTEQERTSSPTSSPSTSTDARTLPPLSSSISRTVPTDMPTVSRGGVNTEVPTYPPPAIPPTRNAPFMNHSTLPDGTVFIAVGAILGAFGVAILLWRAIVACLLHRSVERAALAQHAVNNGRGPGDKNAASFPAPPAQFYKYIERESSASLAGAGLASGTGRRTNRGPTPSATPSQTNLFFSPTAAGPGSGGVGGSNRDSARYLPSGFYASASPVQGGHAQGNSISMSTLRPSSRGRGGHLGPSPPESPDVGPRVVSRNFSTSSLNLNRPPSPGARAPSAYLDDLLDEQPGMFPPAAGNPPPPAGHGSQRGRY